jgi:hypothetical protein
MDPRFLDFGTISSQVVSFTLLSLYPRGMNPRYSLQKRLSGPQGQSGRYGEEKHLMHLLGIEPWAVQCINRRYAY